jgi:hypothetical protein
MTFRSLESREFLLVAYKSWKEDSHDEVDAVTWYISGIEKKMHIILSLVFIKWIKK